MVKVDIYVNSSCGYCFRAKQLLQHYKIKYHEIDITGKPQIKSEMIKRSKGCSTVPQIFIDDNHIGGCDDLYDLERQGKLAALLQK
ncbi:MAG: glutaredoxin 3 [Alphaproteobacteria bacterium]|nr:glutaredoxin 3 [Alphaproteobacteria bacterium]